MSVVCVGCGRDEVYGWEGWRFGDVEGYFRGAAHGRTLVVESGDEKRGWGWTSDGEGSCGEWAERAADPSRRGLHDVADFQAGLARSVLGWTRQAIISVILSITVISI